MMIPPAATGSAPDDPLALARARAAAHGLPLMTEADWPAAPVLPDGLSRSFLRRSLMLPLGRSEDGQWRVALADPSDSGAVSALKAALGANLALLVASQPALLSRLDDLQAGSPVRATEAVQDDPQDSALDAPVIALLDRVLAQAVEARATDVHFEPGA